MEEITDFLGEGGIGIPGKNPDFVVHGRSVTFQCEKRILADILNRTENYRGRNSRKCKFLQYHHSKVNLKYYVSSGLLSYWT
jgi:hypothetical protein